MARLAFTSVLNRLTISDTELDSMFSDIGNYINAKLSRDVFESSSSSIGISKSLRHSSSQTRTRAQRRSVLQSLALAGERSTLTSTSNRRMLARTQSTSKHGSTGTTTSRIRGLVLRSGTVLHTHTRARLESVWDAVVTTHYRGGHTLSPALLAVCRTTT